MDGISEDGVVIFDGFISLILTRWMLQNYSMRGGRTV